MYSPQRELIFDVGMHQGFDTEFYLAKGFRVVAVEANPVLARKAEEKFSSAIADDRLRLLNVAIASRAEPVTFWSNDQYDDWGTTSDEFVQRNAAAGTSMHAVTVPGLPLQRILDEHGTPHYLKIDIEGSDSLCLEALRGREIPQYLSIEADLTSPDAMFAQLAAMWELGYRHFQILNQGCNRWRECPNPAREGQYVKASFGAFSSGLFGEELPDEWMCATDLVSLAKPLVREQQTYGLNAPHYRSIPGRGYKALRRLLHNPVAWYDIHARAEPARKPAMPAAERAVATNAA